ncbi:triose-phosphate isomerase [Roseobacter sp. HKCCD9010]|uniref:triose-phosphate isomerase n=1 Tax=unclassified Roseobacter TaxID=196798 RepID=UPI0014922423|nr:MULTISPECIES: triose-phosphate isomerase [unclassified Roseobacter]MBF9050685.1 triose-phosphate isomerase [Rhodobacterales bacterium HKCCD4356]NNV11897.1 triose-phosphate isomerase [Roseobacter sp. HKCCD7357]NNV18048.1 triose-phosphate isomerase [Roseobacter sp. HKCCD8768]NNV26139.1 triose-phosphate isomerase [Roseobacter sp. HKCCD8192]NNV31775.1 triose-phosphate isomerase [Roseobacter sp. HKCCD9061]
MRRKLAAGNWKMNGLSTDMGEVAALPTGLGVDVLICPPATLIDRMVHDPDTCVQVGGQDCHPNPNGAHTGDISAQMVADAGASHVILGHSERRQDHGETDALVRSKIDAAWSVSLVAVLCIGETEAQYQAGETLDVLRTQLAGSLPDGAAPGNLVIAYEPVWAIGTGLVPTMAEIESVHGFIRTELATRFGTDTADGIRLLYGGSVKPGNADEIFAVPDVDGALVGGASLKAADFGAIIMALDAAAKAISA